MGLAGLVNLSMLLISAALFFGTDVPDTDTLEGVHAGLARVLDQPAAFLFALALLASGLRLLRRRHLRRPGRHAGLHPAQHPADAAPRA